MCFEESLKMAGRKKQSTESAVREIRRRTDADKSSSPVGAMAQNLTFALFSLALH